MKYLIEISGKNLKTSSLNKGGGMMEENMNPIIEDLRVTDFVDSFHKSCEHNEIKNDSEKLDYLVRWMGQVFSMMVERVEDLETIFQMRPNLDEPSTNPLWQPTPSDSVDIEAVIEGLMYHKTDAAQIFADLQQNAKREAMREEEESRHRKKPTSPRKAKSPPAIPRPPRKRKGR